MPIEEFELIAKKVFPYVKRWQPTVAGEPMMSQGFDQMIEMAEAFGVKAEMFTNATLLHDKRIELLAPNLGSMSISFDGATKDTFEFIREGAEFEQVKARTQKMIQYCRDTLPEDEQPRLLLNCTLMERNVRELPTLVRVAATELGVDNLTCFHMFPVTAEMRQQSLVHHREVGLKYINEAFEVARELGFNLRVESLDQITAATATAGGTDRAYPTKDGVVEGFEMREVCYGKQREWPVGQ
jgi:molybdenum cofactor biosynthesis enzyme MoaA